MFLPACSFFESDIKKIDSILQAKEALLQADQDALIVFDIDQTLVDPASKAGQPRYRYDKVFKKYQEQLQQYIDSRCEKDPECNKIFESKMWLNIPSELIEKETLDIIKNLQARKIKIIALTSIHPGKLGVIDKMCENCYESIKRV